MVSTGVVLSIANDEGQTSVGWMSRLDLCEPGVPKSLLRFSSGTFLPEIPCKSDLNLVSDSIPHRCPMKLWL